MPSSRGNLFVKALINSPLHPLIGENFAVITVTGRKTGKPIATPINTLSVDGILTVISMRDRTWWRNLRGGQVAQLHRAGKQLTVRGEIIETPAMVTSSLTKYFAKHPGYAKHFGIGQCADGQLDLQNLEGLSSKHVIIQLFPV